VLAEECKSLCLAVMKRKEFRAGSVIVENTSLATHLCFVESGHCVAIAPGLSPLFLSLSLSLSTHTHTHTHAFLEQVLHMCTCLARAHVVESMRARASDVYVFVTRP
jgi:hypothetical protein